MLYSKNTTPIHCAEWTMNSDKGYAVFAQADSVAMYTNRKVYSDLVRPAVNYVIRDCTYCDNKLHINPFKKQLHWRETLCVDCNTLYDAPTYKMLQNLTGIMKEINDAFIFTTTAYDKELLDNLGIDFG